MGLWALDPDLVHLNHGSFGACPRPVLEAQARWRDRLEADPTGFFGDVAPGAIDDARRRLAGFVGADPAALAFVTNATSGVNVVLDSLAPELRPGDEIVVTSHGYHACRNAVEAVARRTGARVVEAALPFPIESAEEAVRAVLDAVAARTRLVLVDHVTSPTALVLPVDRIVAQLEPSVPVLVDGAHAPGMVPVDLDTLAASYAVGNAHKWLCAPKGSGYLYARADRRDALLPSVVSHGWDAELEPGRSRFHAMFDWPGTFDPSPWLTVPDAIDTIGAILPDGWDGVRAANHAVALEGREVVGRVLGVDPAAPDEMVGAMVTFPLAVDPGLPDALVRDHGIRVGAPVWHGYGTTLRLSAHVYTTADDFERLAGALRATGA
jgi:isopenicillin-N epimerase